MRLDGLGRGVLDGWSIRGLVLDVIPWKRAILAVWRCYIVYRQSDHCNEMGRRLWVMRWHVDIDTRFTILYRILMTMNNYWRAGPCHYSKKKQYRCWYLRSRASPAVLSKYIRPLAS